MKHWAKWRAPQRHLIPIDLVSWLIDTGSLTRRLQKVNQYDFSVQLLGNNWRKPLPEECLSMKVPINQLAMQREVRLMDGERANVYARTIIPLVTYQTMKQRFSALGNKPLGAVLFTEASVKRGAIEVASLKTSNQLYEMAISREKYRPKELWARRSHFYLCGKVLMVNEVFLPSLNWSKGWN